MSFQKIKISDGRDLAIIGAALAVIIFLSKTPKTTNLDTLKISDSRCISDQNELPKSLRQLWNSDTVALLCIESAKFPDSTENLAVTFDTNKVPTRCYAFLKTDTGLVSIPAYRTYDSIVLLSIKRARATDSLVLLLEYRSEGEVWPLKLGNCFTVLGKEND